MKVGTDGILLGAWTRVPAQGRILDIGTGTGIVALMVAQRTDCIVDAIDIDLDAAEQAGENVRESPWRNRITVIHNSLKSYCINNRIVYDMIVCNPPFYISNLKSKDEKKNLARNAESLPLSDLVKHAGQLLKKTGTLVVVLPSQHLQRYKKILKEYKFVISRKTTVKAHEGKSPVRVLVEATKDTNIQVEYSEITLMNTTDNTYTEEYKNLTRKYYLKF